jgi:hypothetical protein
VTPEAFTAQPGAKLWLHSLALRHPPTPYVFDVGGKIFPKTFITLDELYFTSSAVQSWGTCLSMKNAYLEGAQRPGLRFPCCYSYQLCFISFCQQCAQHPELSVVPPP